ncbi:MULTISPECIES: hypothetical protein [unclassified Hyphomonas]|jgi:hypothetical protein|uniref:hypothetical protein n=1 Tax=unclassified Hyphomonas TaxID=2630699 RepID=UPI0008076667|nr:MULTISPECIES: hypothetical protein [unclassified Hyphomonas]RAN40566.1 hypothetical protein HY26_11665 [Hyphomonas sp. GM-8P]
MQWSNARNALLAAGLAVGFAACSPAPAEPVYPPESLSQDPQAPEPVVIPDAVAATRDEMLKYAQRGSLSGLSRLARENPGFVSNLGGEGHREYWDLMRRIGVDPNRKLRALMELPVGVREVDGVKWYVWPDLAAKNAEDLIPEKLSFRDRKRLQDLVGEDGIAEIRAGKGFPGMRTAITEEGEWVYFVLGQEAEE